MPLSKGLRASLEHWTATYEQQIDGASEYLAARGITREVAVTRRLGYVGEPVVGHESYTGRLALPYLTPSGVVDVRFRRIADDDSPKYMSRPGAEINMYGVLAFQTNSDIIAVCEGEFDALVMDELVGVPAIGIPGAQAWRPYYWRAFEDFSKVYIFADGDQPGMDFAKKVATSVEQATIVAMPEGEDVNSMYLSEGPEGLLKRAGIVV